MTDAMLNAALKAAADALPDTHFAILLVGEIPPFGDDRIGPIDVMSTAQREQTRKIILKLAKAIDAADSTCDPRIPAG
jgi:hypothetical protein